MCLKIDMTIHLYLELTLVVLVQCGFGPPSLPHFVAVDTTVCAGLAIETTPHCQIK